MDAPLKPRRRKLTPADVDEVRHLIECDGLTKLEVGLRYGCTGACVSLFCKRFGIVTPPRSSGSYRPRPQPEPPPPPPLPTYTDALGRTVTKLPPGWAAGVEPGKWAQGFDPG